MQISYLNSFFIKINHSHNTSDQNVALVYNNKKLIDKKSYHHNIIVFKDIYILTDLLI